MNHFYIDTNQSGLWFSLIYLITFIMVISVFIVKGLKDHHHFVSLWLIAVTGMLFFIAGSELFPLSLQDLKLFIINGEPSRIGEKSLLGGMLGFWGFLLAIYWLKERVALIDNMAVVFVIGMGIQNIACLKAGCCFGNPGTVPWAVQYDQSSPAFVYQLKQGVVQLTDTVTTPLHPVQLYLLLGCLLIAFVVLKTRNRWHAPLSLLMFGWLLYAALRFVVEFYRDPSTNQGLGALVFGMEAIQWYLLAMIVILSVLIILREQKFRLREKIPNRTESKLFREISLLLFVILFSWFFRGLFGFTEKLLLNSFILISVLLVGWKVFRLYTLPQYRVATLLSVFGSCLLLSQSYIPQNKNEKVTYIEIGGGMQFSQYYEVIQKNLEKADCGYVPGPSIVTKYNSYLGGVSIAKTENFSEYKKINYGLNAYFGADKGDGIDDSYSSKLANIAIQPYLSGSGRWIGFSAGFHLGVFHYADMETEFSDETVGEMVGGPKTLYIFPSFSLRLGPSDLFYAETSLADHFPSASPISLFGYGIGSGLGKSDGRNLGVGYGTTGMYLKTMLPIKQNYYLDGFVSFWPDTYNESNGYYNGENNSHFSISVGLHHRFNYKTVARKPKQ
jgi:prolipoprotein diacylglyceryltransferase